MSRDEIIFSSLTIKNKYLMKINEPLKVFISKSKFGKVYKK